MGFAARAVRLGGPNFSERSECIVSVANENSWSHMWLGSIYRSTVSVFQGLLPQDGHHKKSHANGERSEPFAYNGHHKMETTVFALGNKSGSFCEAVNWLRSNQEGKFPFATLWFSERVSNCWFQRLDYFYYFGVWYG